MLAGHDHHYERFRPIDGIRSFVVGTGGRSLYPAPRRLPASEVVNDRTYGVLRLTLHPDAYDWRFVPVAGSSFTDAGPGAAADASSSRTLCYFNASPRQPAPFRAPKGACVS